MARISLNMRPVPAIALTQINLIKKGCNIPLQPVHLVIKLPSLGTSLFYLLPGPAVMDTSNKNSCILFRHYERHVKTPKRRSFFSFRYIVHTS